MSVIAAVHALPTEGLTVQALRALDSIVPGTWQNTTSFKTMLEEVSGEKNPVVIAALMQRAIALDATHLDSYGRALQVYRLLDSVDQLAAGAAVASKVGSMFGSLGFLQQFTPKPETTQAMDAGLKLMGELLAFGLLNGMPTQGSEGLSRFVGALEDYARYDLMRIAAWVVFDGVIPLGPDFLGKIIGTFSEAANDSLGSNAVFDKLGGQIPGNSVPEKKAFILETLNRTGDFMDRFVKEKGISQDKVMAQVQGVLGVADGGMDYVAAAIDASTDYMTHTGTQTVGRHLAKRTTLALKDEVWQQWVATRT